MNFINTFDDCLLERIHQMRYCHSSTRTPRESGMQIVPNVETLNLDMAKIAGIFYDDIHSCLVYPHTLVTDGFVVILTKRAD